MKKLLRLGGLLVPFAAFAQTPVFGPGGEVSPLTSGQGIIDVLNSLLGWFGIVIGIISVLVVLYAALLFMVAGANEERRGKAKEWLKWGIVGVVVALFATVIVPILIDLLSGTLFTP